MPRASYGVDGMTTFRPGMWAKKASTDCEWYSAPWTPPPYGARSVIGQREGAVGAEAHARRLGQDLVERGEDEVGELDLGHRPQAVDGGADRDADDHRLGQRRVEHAVAAELVVQPVGGQEHAALLAHVLAEHDDRLVAAHLLGERVADRLDEGHDGHQSSPFSTPNGPPSPMKRTPCQNGSSMRAGGASA